MCTANLTLSAMAHDRPALINPTVHAHLPECPPMSPAPDETDIRRRIFLVPFKEKSDRTITLSKALCPGRFPEGPGRFSGRFSRKLFMQMQFFFQKVIVQRILNHR